MTFETKGLGVTKIIEIHHLGTMNAKSHANLAVMAQHLAVDQSGQMDRQSTVDFRVKRHA